MKLKIGLLALKGDMSINDICQQYQVAPSLVHAWRKQILDEGAILFDKPGKSKGKKAASSNAHVQSQLYEKIGQLTVERDFLKKAWGTLHGNGDEE